MRRKIKHFLFENRFVILKTFIILCIIACIAVGGYFLLKGLGFTTQEDMARLRDELGDTFVFWLVIGLLQIVQVIFIPVSNQLITVPVALCFPDDLWKVWITSWISIWIATMILYFVGRWGGKKLLGWILKDEEQVERCSNFLKRGWIFYPLAMLLPLPDDIVTTLAGTAKMNLLFVLICSCMTRAVDTACSVWGWGYLTKHWWGWIVLTIGFILLGVMTFLFYKWQKKHNKSNEPIDTREIDDVQ